VVVAATVAAAAAAEDEAAVTEPQRLLGSFGWARGLGFQSKAKARIRGNDLVGRMSLRPFPPIQSEIQRHGGVR
jgi:hypothetical protein